MNYLLYSLFVSCTGQNKLINVNVEIFQLNADILNFLFIKESWKKCIVFHKYPMKNIEHQIIILEWFLKDNVTLRLV